MAYVKSKLSDAECKMVADAAKTAGISVGTMAGALVRIGLAAVVAQADTQNNKPAEESNEAKALTPSSRSPYGNR